MRILAIVLGAACLCLAGLLLILGQAAQKKQLELARQQDEINKGSLSQQVGANLLRDMAQVGVRNERMRGLLQKHGFTLNVNTNQPVLPTGSAK